MAIEHYKTDNVSLAAYLMENGHTVQGFEFVNEKRTWAKFVFADTGDLADFVDDFFSHRAKTNPESFNRQLGKARTELYNFVDSEGDEG